MHIVVAQVDAPPPKRTNTSETTIFLQEYGFWVQWDLFGHLCWFLICVPYLVFVLVFSSCFGPLVLFRFVLAVAVYWL